MRNLLSKFKSIGDNHLTKEGKEKGSLWIPVAVILILILALVFG
jgi:hypothetical protein